MPAMLHNPVRSSSHYFTRTPAMWQALKRSHGFVQNTSAGSRCVAAAVIEGVNVLPKLVIGTAPNRYLDIIATKEGHEEFHRYVPSLQSLGALGAANYVLSGTCAVSLAVTWGMIGLAIDGVQHFCRKNDEKFEPSAGALGMRLGIIAGAFIHAAIEALRAYARLALDTVVYGAASVIGLDGQTPIEMFAATHQETSETFKFIKLAFVHRNHEESCGLALRRALVNSEFAEHMGL